MKAPRLWLVTWMDAIGTNSWEDRKAAIKYGALMECQVVGRLLRVTKKDITIAGGWSEGDKVTTLHVIPRSNVVSWQLLKIGRPTRRVATERV
jgi:hypothetical protein